MKKILLATMLSAMATSVSAAPLIDVYGGINSWRSKASGYVGTHSEGNVDLKDDLGFGSDNTVMMYLGIEHVVPFVPNARLRHVTLKDSAKGEINQTVKVDGETFTGGTDVRSKYDVDMTDLTLYYSPWKTLVQIDAGLTLRHVDAKFDIEGGGQKARLSASHPVPMGHLAISGDLPLTGLYAGAEINHISYSSNRFEDMSFKLGWRSPFLLGIEAGYSQFSLKLDDVSDVDSSIDWKGPYVALSLDF